LQTDLVPLSATQRYRARPEAPVRYDPIGPFVVAIEALDDELIEEPRE
jgi:hypothetical protein